MQPTTVPPSVIESIISFACALNEDRPAFMRGYNCDGNPADRLAALGFMVEDPNSKGRYFATVKGLSYAGYTLPDLPDARGLKCKCGPYPEKCSACHNACPECQGAGQMWLHITIDGHKVPTFRTIPCLSCDQSGWRQFERIVNWDAASFKNRSRLRSLSTLLSMVF